MRDNFHSHGTRASALLAWISAVIVLGITAWFRSMSDGAGRHLHYQLTVAALTVALWPAVAFLSRRAGSGPVTGMRRHVPFLALAFSYLWLAAVVVSIDDWAESACHWTWPPGRCAYKHTVIAFNFLAFFFTYATVLLESVYAPYTDSSTAHTKHGHHAGTTTTTV